MSDDDTPPELDGITWYAARCPSCGATWWQGLDDDQAQEDELLAELRRLLGTCPECRA